MLSQKSGGSIVTISAALADNHRGVTASLSMITKGGLNAVTEPGAGIRERAYSIHAVAPGCRLTASREDPEDSLKTLSRWVNLHG